MFLAKTPSYVEVINDVHRELVSFYRCAKYHREALLDELDTFGRDQRPDEANPLRCDGRLEGDHRLVTGTLMIRAVAISFAFTLASHAAVLDVPRFPSAIRQVEDWRGRDGRLGERGPWQITAAVWSMHMPGIPFAEARQEGPARVCAVKHVAWVRTRLREAGVDDNAFNVALCWNAGVTGTTGGRAPLQSYDYGRRVVNLYQSGAPLTVMTTRTRPDTTATKAHGLRPPQFQIP